MSKLKWPIRLLAVGAGVACPKTQSKLFSGERTSPLRTKRQHYPRFDTILKQFALYIYYSQDCNRWNYFSLPSVFSSFFSSGLMIPFTVSPIGNLSSTPRLGATVFTNVFKKLLVPPLPPSNTVILPKLICSNAFTYSPAISFHWSTILY